MKIRNLIGICAAVGLVPIQALAGSASWDFTADPTDPTQVTYPLTLLGGGNGGGDWINWDYGSDGTTIGFLSITGPTAGQWAKIIFPDIDDGVTIAAFTFECMLRVGNGTASPADGFNISYARASDPTFTKDGSGNYQAGGWSGTVNEPGSVGGSMAGLAEEGTITGLSIGFDAWQSNSEMWPLDLNAGLFDVIGLSVRVDNKIVAQVSLPTLNGACADNTSLQTGPQGTSTPDDWTVLCWQPFKVQLTEDKHLSVWWKGRAVVDNLLIDFNPSAGRLVFGGRTGDAYQNTHVDNIVLTTIPADKPLIGNATADAISVTVLLEDAGTSTVDQDTVTMTVNGAAATPLAFSKDGPTTTVRWASPTYLASGANLAVYVEFKDNSGRTISGTRTATVAAYARVPAAYQVPTASVDTGKPGFLLRPYQTEAAQPNTLIWTEGQLLGWYGENIADLTGATGGFYTHDGVVNFNMDAPNNIGNFTGDTMFPGFPGTTFSTGNATEEVLTYIEFPTAGMYQLGVNSDDGFRVTAGRAPGDLLGVILGSFDGGRGASDTVFTIVVDPPGIYPIRLIWENGSGELPGNGANCEFFSVKDGVKTLINDVAGGGLKAYRESTAAGPWVSDLTPLRGATGVAGNATVMAVISHGSVTVDEATVVAKLNGVVTPANVTTAAGKTTVTVQPPGGLLPSGTATTITIDFSDKATPAVAYSTAWTFTVATYTVLSDCLWTAPGTADTAKPGLKARVWQVDQLGTVGLLNYVHRAEQELAGVIGPNVADLTEAADGWFVCDMINWNAHLGEAEQGSFQTSSTPSRPDGFVPGIPGLGNASYNTDNIAAEIITYIEFPTAGFYGMGVNSDDGFKVTVADTPPKYNLSLMISGDPAVAGNYHTAVAPVATAKPFTSGVSGKLVYMDPAEGCAAPVNAAALAGNIALVDRGTCEFTAKIKNAKDAGAIAVVVVNTRTTDLVTWPEGVFPIEMGAGAAGYQDIPAVMISKPDGDKIKAALASGLTASLIPDLTPAVGIADYGKGASDIIFYFIVPKAGVYPFRCVWFEGGGGDNCEWFSVTASGQKILLNDLENTAALKTYQARTAQPEPCKETYSIGLNFGADEASGSNSGTLAAKDVAGVPAVAQANWNNLRLATGSGTVMADAYGVPQATAVTVVWNSANTWASTGRGEENNALTGADKVLMTGYLDTGAPSTTTVKIAGIPDDLYGAGYDVYVYALGGVEARGGGYRVLGADGTNLVPGPSAGYVDVQGPMDPTTYVEAIPAAGAWAVGNYMVFRGLSGQNAASITVEATTASPHGYGGTHRAPINAIQLVAPTTAVPVPTITVAKNADGTITISWTNGGTLQAATSILGPWQDVTATSPYTFTPEAGVPYMFGRIKK
ncbi:MAG TPA: hypothetical protein P5534_04130 [Candidatus Paceibacterota bacterium]|nr:hypothetical protein [Candidatus Paceibacterota bacterium]